MAKDSLNIIDFSGGFNNVVNKRDLQDNESALVVDLLSYNSGALKSSGAFVALDNFGKDQNGFGENVALLNSCWYLQPSHHFMQYNKGVAVAPDSATCTITSADHGLTSGTEITIIKDPTGAYTVESYAIKYDFNPSASSPTT